MKIIYTSKGQEIFVDDEDYEYLSGFKWNLARGYAYRTTSSKGGLKRNRLAMHREIMNTPKGRDTDHKNRNRLDNRKENLRICTRSQNLSNKTKINTSSNYKGVYPHYGSWRASITVNTKVKNLGTYNNQELAAKAYNKAAKEHFGEFSYLNEVIDVV